MKVRPCATGIPACVAFLTTPHRQECLWYLALLTSTLLSGQTTTPRIAIGQFMHESNSFNPAPTGYSDFLHRAHNMSELRMNKDEVSGFLEGAERYHFESYLTVLTGAVPKGPVTDDAFNRITSELIQKLQSAPKLDGLLLALHGAMVSEKYPQADAEVMRRLRKALGPTFPIVVTHDFHANVSQEIVDLTTALITYKENPHIDAWDRGVQAARIMSGIVSGKFRPAQALAKPPMLFNIRYLYTSVSPWRPFLAETRNLERDNPKILAASASGGYQYSDVPSIGPAS